LYENRIVEQLSVHRFILKFTLWKIDWCCLLCGLQCLLVHLNFRIQCLYIKTIKKREEKNLFLGYTKFNQNVLLYLCPNWIIDVWWKDSLYSHMFWCLSQVQYIWLVVGLLYLNPHWWSRVISSTNSLTRTLSDNISHALTNSVEQSP
jgi:hypothetical protein